MFASRGHKLCAFTYCNYHHMSVDIIDPSGNILGSGRSNFCGSTVTCFSRFSNCILKVSGPFGRDQNISIYGFFCCRLLEMRMPRSASSFSVRDILDLPQIQKNNSTSDTQGSSPTHTTDIRFHGKLITYFCHLSIQF